MGHLDLGELHVVFLHFPIVLFWVALVYDILGAFFKKNVYPAAHWFVIVAALSAIPTVITGLIAFDEFVTNPYVHMHRNWALATFTVGFFYALYRAYLLIQHKRGNKYFLVALTFLAVILVSITAYYGGEVAFGPLKLFK